jgi:hypothetical protein
MNNRSGIIIIICPLPFYGFYQSAIPHALLVFLLMKLFYYVYMVFIDKRFHACSWCVLLVFSLMKMTLYLLPSSVRHAAGRLLVCLTYKANCRLLLPSYRKRHIRRTVKHLLLCNSHVTYLRNLHD